MIGGVLASAAAGPNGGTNFERSIHVLERKQRYTADEARQASRQLVADALVRPILASMRENSRASGLFAPTDAEKRFGPMLDEAIADRVIESSQFKLPDLIADRWLQGRDGTT